MPRPEIFGTAAARKKRARKPWTPQRTIFNTFIAFIYLSLSSVFSGIFTPLCWVRPESGPEGLDLSDEQSGWITAPSGPENGPPSVALGSRTPGSGIPQAPARSTATVPLCQEVSGPQKLCCKLYLGFSLWALLAVCALTKVHIANGTPRPW